MIRRLPALAAMIGLTLAWLFVASAPSMAADAPSPKDFIAGYTAFVKGDYASAQALWRGLAERGDLDAAFNLATLYDNGYGGPIDTEQAMAWYARAAQKKIGPAEVALTRLERLAKAADKSKPSDPNADAALRTLTAAAERGSAEAQFSLAVTYERGVGVVQNYATAAAWYQRAAAQGLTEAQYNLATLYDEGLGLKKDSGEALRWYQTAANAGNALAANNLGYLHEFGIGVSQNDVAAFAWYRRAAEAGLDTAQSNLAVMYQTGRGTPRNFDEAARWFRAAAEQGHPEAQLSLGVMFANGLGTTKDLVEALSWLLRAMSASDGALITRAAALRDELMARLDSRDLMMASARAAAFTARPTLVTLSTRSDGRPQPRTLGGFAELTLTVQRYLSLLGFYDGPVDGSEGQKTRAAVLAFRRQFDPRAKDSQVTLALIEALAQAYRQPAP
jgi:TPR repeat protein